MKLISGKVKPPHKSSGGGEAGEKAQGQQEEDGAKAGLGY